MNAKKYNEFIKRLEPLISYSKKNDKIVIIKTNILSRHRFRMENLPYVIKYYKEDGLAIYIPTWITSCCDLQRFPIPEDYNSLDDKYGVVEAVIDNLDWEFFKKEFKKACESYTKGKVVTSGYMIDD